MKMYSEELIRRTLSSFDLDADEFFKVLTSLEEADKILPKIREFQLYKEQIHTISDTFDLDFFVDKMVKKHRDVFSDLCFCYAEIPDGGLDEKILFKINEKIYLVLIHCSAEWCGDWSVRANLPGSLTVKSIKEITEYEVIESSEDYMEISIKE